VLVGVVYTQIATMAAILKRICEYRDCCYGWQGSWELFSS